jgi:hypothetical protein
MPLLINRKIFDRFKAVIAQAKRMNMLYWAESQYSNRLSRSTRFEGC